ncbi:MAG TPA: biotin/lipoyl-containing protein [Thermoanaerobaculaceae bacterium]|nr:biotin/lipoyl-containing protein [Thermoanaerobaculaceae bacterium]
MRWWIERDGRRVDVSARRLDGAWEVTIDGTWHVVEMVPVHTGLDALFLGDGRNYAVASQRLARDHWRVSLAQLQFEVRLRGPLERVAGAAAAHAGPHEVRAPIPGRVVSIGVREGQEVKAGQALVVLEAMKMENQICAEGAGRVERVAVEAGATVESGQILVVIQ